MNISMNVSENVKNAIDRFAMDVAIETIKKCGNEFGFDSDLVIRNLNLDVIIKKVKKDEKRKLKVGVSGKVKSAFPLPFSGEVNDMLCGGLTSNHGLYTQCQNLRKENEFCVKCTSQCSKNENGKPDCGSVKDRLSVGLMDYRDSKGKGPKCYEEIMKKLKLTREMVIEEANKLNMKVDEIHFEKRSIEEKKKGRPKKSKKVLELNSESSDLFAELVAKASESCSDSDSDSECEEVEVEVNKSSFVEAVCEEIVEEEPVAKEAAKAEDKAAKAEDKAAKKAAEKAEKEAEKVAEKAAEKAAKEAEKVAEKAAKEAEKAAKEAEKVAEKAAKEAEKAAKEAEKVAKAEEKAAKEAEKAAKEAEKAAKTEEKAPKEKTKKAVEVKSKEVATGGGGVVKSKEVATGGGCSEPEKTTEKQPDVVKRFEFEGKKYLRSKNTGIVYNLEQDVVGKWNGEKNKIEFINQENTDDESEEEEEEYIE
jgi:hypothetical protein